MVNTEPAKEQETWATPPMPHAVLAASAIPAPDSVMATPGLAAEEAIVVVGVNDTVAVVEPAAFTLDERVIARLLIHEMAGNVPAVVESTMVGEAPVKSAEVPAARLLNAACPLVGFVNPVTVTVMADPPL